jgi:CBS domain-containing protein
MFTVSELMTVTPTTVTPETTLRQLIGVMKTEGNPRHTSLPCRRNAQHL